jgi:hypothetical protein
MPLEGVRCIPKLCPNREARKDAEKAKEGQAGRLSWLELGASKQPPLHHPSERTRLMAGQDG